jgi:hypothetical protein
MCILELLQVGVNLRDFIVADRRPRNHRHQADPLPDDRGEFRQRPFVRHYRRPLRAAAGRPVARLARAHVCHLAGMLLVGDRRVGTGEPEHEIKN